ncbi:MAG: sodium/solute symporter [Alphaproteobacteria bacterium]|nr:sodium/solute symporter [Alphaproteobacteria bacterium]
MRSQVGNPDSFSIALFLLFIILSGFITYWAAKKTKTTDEFFSAGGNITGFQNGLALAGDFISASSFLGFTGLIVLCGFDSFIYIVGGLMGWPLLLFLVAEPLRNLGKYTFTDALITRFSEKPIRTASSISSLVIIIFYMITQMVGAGTLIKLIFGIDYLLAEILVGTVMIGYVLFGGMLATTWVQIIKAVLLLIGSAILVVLVLSEFDFNPLLLFKEVGVIYGDSLLRPGNLYLNPWEAVSVGIAFMFGTVGLPHLLMRFYTVANPKAARMSVFYATTVIGIFYLFVIIMGFGALVLVGQETIRSLDKGGNVSALLLAEVTGGTPLLGFIAAVTFSTILAVVAGLTLSGAAAISHDLWVGVIRKGPVSSKEQLLVARITTVGLGILSVILGIAFQGQNVTVLVGLAFAIAGSATFPALILCLYWRRHTTQGAVASMVFGTLGSVLLIVLSPTVMVDVFHCSTAIFPLKSPAILTIPASFIIGIIVSLLTKDKKALDAYAQVQSKMVVGHS